MRPPEHNSHDFEDDNIKEYPSGYKERPPTIIKKEKPRKQKYSSNYKGGPLKNNNEDWEEATENYYNDNEYRTIVARPPSRQPQRQTYDDQEISYTPPPNWRDTDTGTAYTNPQSGFKSQNYFNQSYSRQSPPPYIITSNNYGGRYNYGYSQQFTPPPNNNNHNNYSNNNYNANNRHVDADIGFGQGMEVLDESRNQWGR